VVEFVLVYVREAHPADGWTFPDWSRVEDPDTHEQRMLVAVRCQQELQFDFTTVVDSLDDRTAQRWSAWPERLFVVSRVGRVVYTGDQGPFGFNPAADFPGYRGARKLGIDLETFLDAYLPTKGVALSRAPGESLGPLLQRH
jgi:type I thyroxine 5'-deiodinase